MKNIILLHGAIGAKDQLEPLAIELKQNGYTVYTLSFSGHGQTPFQTHFGIEQFALELEQFIKENNKLKIENNTLKIENNKLIKENNRLKI